MINNKVVRMIYLVTLTMNYALFYKIDLKFTINSLD